MKKSFGNYRRLARSLLGMSSIWMGEDHVVFVKGSGFILPFTEHYRRFRYQDIQYLAVTRTSRAGGLVLYLLGFLLFAGITAAIIGFWDSGGLGAVAGLSACAGLAAIFLFLFLRHLFLGPACVCDLKTSLRRERLGPLNRLHQANQAVELLAKLISEKQASLTATQASRGNERVLTVEEIRRAEAQRITVSHLVPAAAGVCGLFSLALGALPHVSNDIVTAVALFLLLAAVFLVIAAIVASVRRVTPESIRRGLFWLLGLILSTNVVALVYFIQRAAADPSLTLGLGPLQAFRDIRLTGGAVYYSLFLGAAILFFFVSITLLLLASRWRRLVAQSTVPEPGPHS